MEPMKAVADGPSDVPADDNPTTPGLEGTDDEIDLSTTTAEKRQEDLGLDLDAGRTTTGGRRPLQHPPPSLEQRPGHHDVTDLGDGKRLRGLRRGSAHQRPSKTPTTPPTEPVAPRQANTRAALRTTT
ncbi:hypothetical protein PLESTB_001922000 [Pleodorina starrii]|uniref:Uncharacterized protein n=1 Tax=Pleodorina starrii TaxID=330485 RepID=A0A9W6FAR8_9CHLO|nr:hypothetical protein PLESTB_001922000 [Pleodorina starrii]